MSRQRSTLEVGSIHRGVVARIESFGAFINISGPGNDRGLVHISQLAKDRVESVRDVVEENEEIYVKVLSVDVDPEGRQKISLSMKYCGQGDGSDRDPHMIEYEESMRNRQTRSYEGAKPLELGAIYNTRCSKCGGAGHIASECYNTGEVQYELVPEEEPPQFSRAQPERAPHPPVGRGRGAVVPAWMNDESRLGETGIGSSRKRKASDGSVDRERKHKHKSKAKKEKKDKKEKKEKKEKKKHHKKSSSWSKEQHKKSTRQDDY